MGPEISFSNAHRKRIVHNLVYRHADHAAADAKWGSLFPQAFCIDDVAGQVFTLSDQPCVVSVYDWNTGQYLSCFSIAGKSALSQSTVIRRIGGRRYLYLRTGGSTMGRVDITSLPPTLTSLTPQTVATIPLTADFDWFNGVWTCGTPISSYGDQSYINRGRFIRRDENFNEVGLAEVPALRIGGNWGSGQYALKAIPKAQGFRAGPNCFAIGMGGGIHLDAPPAGGETAFHMHGIRVFNSGGELLAENLVPANQLASLYEDLGFSPTFLECEGLAYAYGNFYTLNVINRGADPQSLSGGFLIQQEFVEAGTPGSFEVFPVASGYTVPSTQFTSIGPHPVGDDLVLRNQVTWEPLTTLAQALALMQNIGQHRLAFYTGVTNLTDFGGTPFPADSYIEIVNLANLQFEIRIASATGSRTLRVSKPSPTGAWTTEKSDSGWVNIAVGTGHAAISTNERPRIRKKDGNYYFRGGWSGSSLPAANTAYTVGSLPAGFAVGENILIPGTTNLGASSASVLVSMSGSIQIRTGATPGAYYKLDGNCVPVD